MSEIILPPPATTNKEYTVVQERFRELMKQRELPDHYYANKPFEGTATKEDWKRYDISKC